MRRLTCVCLRIAAGALLLAATVISCGNEAEAGGACDLGAEIRSAAHLWNDVALDGVRRDFPAPTVHARNLYHLAVVSHDAWQLLGGDGLPAFDYPAELLDRASRIAHVEASQNDAISFGAATLLEARYRNAVSGDVTVDEIRSTLDALCDGSAASDADSAAAFGTALAEHVVATSRDDGSREAWNYDDFSYAPVNPPLIVASDEITMPEPARWQPLSIDERRTQNGQSEAADVQAFIGPNWGDVTPFAIPTVAGLPIDPGPPPEPDTDEWFAGIEDVLRWSASLAPGEVTVDNAPAGINPSTNEPYEPNVVDRADWLRSIAEYWADGPDSETPPGHWNSIANQVGDDLVSLGQPLTIAGGDDPVSRLEWDVKVHLALNGATHDAAIATWATKVHYDYARPISMIRLAATLGQSSDEDAPSFHPKGLPLIDDLVTVVSAANTEPGEPLAHLREHIGEIAVRSWIGQSDPDADEAAGVDWILGRSWLPYQRPSFVSPAFAAYASGHSAFSRAAADVLAWFTDSEHFPGGLVRRPVEAGSLWHDGGPINDLELQWATFREAADEAGFSRRPGGIHVPADDLAGREIGAHAAVFAIERVAGLWASSG